MKCNKCGKEILDDDKICTNCGKRVHRQKKKSFIKGKLTYCLVAIVVFIIVISIVVFAIIKNNGKQNTDKENGSQTLEENKYKVEIGIAYNYIEDDYFAILNFNTDKDFIIRSGFNNSDETMEIGTYTIDNNIIKLIVNYNSNNDYGKDDNPNYVDTPYNLEMTILDDGNIYTDTIIYTKESTTATEEIETNNNSNNLLNQIYTKYPEFKDKEGYICTDGEQYWLIDSLGDKAYFNDLESFEKLINEVNKNNIISRNEFLNNYLTDEFKQIVKEQINIIDYFTFLEDRIEIDSDKIRYTYIGVYNNGTSKPSLQAKINYILLNKQIPSDYDSIKHHFDEYFIIKEIETVSDMFMDFNGVVTDNQISDKMLVLNKEISEKLEEIHSSKLNTSQLESIAKNIFLNCQPTNFKQLMSEYNIQTSPTYTQIINKNHVLVVKSFQKRTISRDYKVSGYNEYVTFGGYFDLSNLPLVAYKFSAKELIQTGYININEKDNFVTTDVSKIMDTENYSKQDYEQFYKVKDEYVRNYFGIQ